MRPTTHAAISGVVSIVFFYLTKAWPATIGCFLSGIFIDLDHLPDFMLHKKKIIFSYDELWCFCAREREGKIYLVLHSYELLTLFALAIPLFDLGLFWIGIWLGMVIHILADEVANPLKPLGYFFFYRLKNGFEKKKLFREDFYEKLV